MCKTEVDVEKHARLPQSMRRLVLAIAANIVFVAAESIFGFRYDSMGLLADAGHNLSDVFGLMVSLLAMLVQSRRPTRTFSYGFKSATLLACLVNSLVLMAAIVLIVLECLDKFLHGSTASGSAIMVTAGIGILVNGATTWLLSEGKDTDLNAKGAYLHMLADTLVSAGVVLAGAIILQTRCMWIDPAVGIVIAGIILWSSKEFFKETFILVMNGVPAGLESEQLQRKMASVDNVTEVHHVHIWALSTTETALTAHIRLQNGSQLEHTKKTLKALLENCRIEHSTLEFELPDADSLPIPGNRQK